MSFSNDYPIVGYRFIVTIFSALIPNPIDIHFKEVSGLKVSRTISRKNQMTSLGSELPQQTLTLKRGVTTSISPLVLSQILETSLWGTRMFRKDLLVCVLDDNSIPMNSWMVNNAYLSSWSWEGISGDSKDVLIESMEFSYNSLIYMPVQKPSFADDILDRTAQSARNIKQRIDSKVKTVKDPIEDALDDAVDSAVDSALDEVDEVVNDVDEVVNVEIEEVRN